MVLSAIRIYPVKSTAGLDLASCAIDARGLVDDRRWMVVEPSGRFITGREAPRLVLVRATPRDGGLRIDAPGMPACEVAAPGPAAETLGVSVWDDRFDAACAGTEADAWFGAFLQRGVRLVMVDARSVRSVAPDGRDGLAFADGYPFLAISQASLDALNSRASSPVTMQRFRPNLVIDGCPPHAEDAWRAIRIGDVLFESAKPCTRCVFTTVDPASGARDPSGEPLRTLKTYRRTPEGITFGMNWIARGRGTLHVGDRVEPA